MQAGIVMRWSLSEFLIVTCSIGVAFVIVAEISNKRGGFICILIFIISLVKSSLN